MGKKTTQADPEFTKKIASARDWLAEMLSELQKHFAGQVLNDGDAVLSEILRELAKMEIALKIELKADSGTSTGYDSRYYVLVDEIFLGSVDGSYRLSVFTKKDAVYLFAHLKQLKQ